MSKNLLKCAVQTSAMMKNIGGTSSRNYSPKLQEKYQRNDKMLAWQIHSYGKLEELQLSQNSRIPYITRPDDVLVKVEAASVNPLDVAMIDGYGATALNLMRCNDSIEFPLTLGRDFCGTVVSKGLGHNNKMPLGSAVWGVVPVHQQGCHAEYVITDRRNIGLKPPNLSAPEAASLLYTGLTAWSGLRYSANLPPEKMSGLRALVLGGAGGVGSAAVQMLHAGGARVAATCATDAVPLVEALGADLVMDYKAHQHQQQLVDNGPYDLILDCAGIGIEEAMKKSWYFRNYVSFTTPLLKNLDSLGLVRGLMTSASNLICPNVEALKKGRTVKWAYFVPSQDAIQYISDLVISKRMRPVVEKTYEFSETAQAYQRMKDGHLRGKIVINMTENQ